jgi:hypothetical protein
VNQGHNVTSSLPGTMRGRGPWSETFGHATMVPLTYGDRAGEGSVGEWWLGRASPVSLRAEGMRHRAGVSVVGCRGQRLAEGTVALTSLHVESGQAASPSLIISDSR